MTTPTNAPAIRITGLSNEGHGVCRLPEGQVVFVEGGVPGDLVELEGLSIRKRLGRAQIGKLLEASDDRTTPQCQHFGQCGGCLWQHIDYAAQLRAKSTRLRDALTRIGGQSIEEAVPIEASPNSYGYRARTRLLEQGSTLGYRQRGSHNCVVVKECPILIPTVQTGLLEWSSARNSTTDGQEWEIMAGSKGPAIVHSANSAVANTETVQLQVQNLILQATAGSFLQGNALLWEKLVSYALEQCLIGTVAQGTKFIELYAGMGFLTVPLANAGCTGEAVESSVSAVQDLKANLLRANVSDRVKVISGLAEHEHNWSKRFAQNDLLLVDPPRVGLHKSIRFAIAAHGPQRVVYVSCDPATLARDVKALCEGGYRLAHVQALDLFPQTPHVEAIVRLER